MPERLTSLQLGGQAVLEGVMMRSPRWWTVAVRRPDGSIHLESHPLEGRASRSFLRRTPLRGAAALADAMGVAVRALAISARESSPESEQSIEPGHVGKALLGILAFFVLLFVIVPALAVPGDDQRLVRNLLEGLVRFGVFAGYIAAISRMKETSRVFGYHGAEHKAIAAWEAGEPLTHDGVRRFSTVHVRCGTNFLWLVMFVALVAFLPLPRDPLWWRLVLRVLLVPVVAAAAYELLRLSARFAGSAPVRLLTWPGRLLQRVTTKEPGPDQVEVALSALSELLAREDAT